MTEINIREGEKFIRLSQAMKKAGLVGMGAEAKGQIRGGLVKVNGEVEDRPGRKLYAGDSFVFDGQEYRVH